MPPQRDEIKDSSRCVQSSIGDPRSACDRVPHSSRSHALAVVRFPAGGTKGTSGALDRTRLRLKWVRPKALRNWNATHSGSDCNVTCNVEHIQRYTLRYNQTYFVSSVALRQRHGTSVGSFNRCRRHKMYLCIPILPLASSIVAGLFGRFVGPTGASLITTSCLYLALFFSCVCFYEVGLCGAPCHISAAP